LGLETLETAPAYVVIYDSAGRESVRQTVPPRPGAARDFSPWLPHVEPSSAQAWFGLITSPAEAAVLVGTTRDLESDVRGNHGTEVPLLLQFLITQTQFFLPGIDWDPRAHAGQVFGFAALMLLSAAASALVCFLLARRYAFSRSRRIGWALCGFLFGWTGLALMLALQDWPARVSCPSCRRPRRVDRERCEHCGAAHAVPTVDGTEIFEEAASAPHAALAAR
jgi:hypothetical protein